MGAADNFFKADTLIEMYLDGQIDIKYYRQYKTPSEIGKKAELDLKKIEEKAEVLKTRVKPKVAASVPIPVSTSAAAKSAPHSPRLSGDLAALACAPVVPQAAPQVPVADFMKQVERMLDEILPRKSHKRRERSPSASSNEPTPPKRKALVRQEPPPQPRYAPAPAQVAALAARTVPPAWYDALTN